MQHDFSSADAIVCAALERVFPAAQIEVRQSGEVLWSAAYGWLDPETRTRPVARDTLFDLASVTKLFVVTTFMTLVEAGRVGLDQPVASVLPEFSGARPIQAYDDPLNPGAMVTVEWEVGAAPAATHVDAGRVTFRHLLTHTSGLPAWRPLFRAGSPQAARCLALTTYFSYPTAARIIYSDIGLILIGLAIERLTGLSLDAAVAQRITDPLGLTATRYVRISESRMGKSANQQIGSSPSSDTQYATRNTAPTEFCVWRNRRIVGEVHDENAAGLDGAAGHAGLFSPVSELAAFGETFLASQVSSQFFGGSLAVAGLPPSHARGSVGDRPQPPQIIEKIPSQQVSKSASQQVSKSASQQINESANQSGEPDVSRLTFDASRFTPHAPRPTPHASRPTLLHPDTLAEMTRVQAQDGATRRGIGFALWSPDGEASSHPFSERAFGHTGFTGTSLWMDPARDLTVAVCTNRVYYGRDAGGILAFRVALHRAIVEAMEAS